MVEITRHFTSSTYVVYKNKVLLHKHKRYPLILPPGGHLNRDELPHEAAIREVKEESGLDIELYNPKEIKFNDGSIELNLGMHSNLHFINEFHQHIDLIFYATSKSDKIKPGNGESKHWEWYTKEEIETSTYIKDNVKFYASEALELLRKK